MFITDQCVWSVQSIGWMGEEPAFVAGFAELHDWIRACAGC